MKLSELSLKKNKIADIDGDTFDGLKSLELLDLSNNKLKTVKKSSKTALEL